MVSLPAPIPSIRKYWGEARDYDQRLVELAAIGFALRLAEEQLWQSLAAPEKERALAYFLPMTTVPQLFAELPADKTVLISTVIAEGKPQAVRQGLARPPPDPT